MDAYDLTGKVALVTGGNRGIGRAIALGLAQRGAAVVVAARDEAKTAATVAEIAALSRSGLGVKCDVRSSAEIEAALHAAEQRFGGLDILVNNAGVAGGGFPESIPDAEWERVVDTNLKAVFVCCKLAHPRLKQRGRGKIINIGSEYGTFGSPLVLPYACAKGGITQLTKSLAIAWAKDRIQVNQIVPGWIRTDMTRMVEANDAFRQMILARTPEGRFGEPEECAGAAVFLASAASDFVTGQALHVDGGYSVM